MTRHMTWTQLGGKMFELWGEWQGRKEMIKAYPTQREAEKADEAARCLLIPDYVGPMVKPRNATFPDLIITVIESK